MLRVLGVHGTGTYRYHRRAGSVEGAAVALGTDWFRHLGTAMPPNSAVDLRLAYYGHELRTELEEDPALLEPGEQQLLIQWAELLRPGAAPITDPRDAAELMAHNFGPATRLFALSFCRELHAYLTDPERRAACRHAVAAALAEHRPDVVLAHSLGAVVAYESLWDNKHADVGLLLTVGSPLAMPGMLPTGAERSRPPSVRRWVNMADVGDIVAVPTMDFPGAENVSIVAGMWEYQTPGAYLRSRDVTLTMFGSRPTGTLG
ncbi:hypothetical protein [Amycolatopsis sp.]|uniref:hypothetical protein n=1 Tax=Amycolatopsis sp. TaxID=37632 RepID=UPI002CD5AA9B|nr:hypothetical protein [Amycolatopsis sp.]HVV08692.1 hypothetical protein [Amycolatopsis sp.]